MAFYTYTQDPIGVFVEKEVGNYFEYSVNDDMDMPSYYKWPHKVWVGGEGVCGDQGYRYAEVKKTVVYIVVDEDDCGEPVVEKWYIKGHKEYA
jgi:hypothetical protein